MRTLIGVVVAAGLAAIGLGFWLSSASQSATEISSVSTPTSVSDFHLRDPQSSASRISTSPTNRGSVSDLH
jgi:hypothetical protein